MAKPTIEVHFLTQLKEIIAQEIAENGVACDLNHLDLSEMQDFSGVFKGSLFQGDISRWSLNSVLDMRGMFAESTFAGDLSSWSVNPLIYLNGMFSPEFKGTLPALLDVPIKERTFTYSKMFNGDEAFSKYLESQSFSKIHVAFLANTSVSPTWLAQEELVRFRHAHRLGLALGCTPDELYTLLQEQLLALKTGAMLESLEIDFSQ